MVVIEPPISFDFSTRIVKEFKRKIIASRAKEVMAVGKIDALVFHPVAPVVGILKRDDYPVG